MTAQRTDALVDRVDRATDALLSRFSSIVDLSRTGSAANALQTENHAHQMTRAAAELRTIIREVKESWALHEPLGHATSDNDQDEDTTIGTTLRDVLKELGT